MKRLVMCFALLSFVAFAQQDPNQQRVIELKNTSDYGRLEAFVSAFGVGIKPSPNERFIVLRGTKEQLDAAEAAIRKIDVPKKDIEVVFQIVSAGGGGPDKIPADLEPVIKQLKKTLVYQGYRLVDTIEVRTREGKPANASSVVELSDANSLTATYSVQFIPALASDEKGVVVRLDDLRFGAHVPILPPRAANAPAGTGAVVTGSFSYAEAGFHQSVDVREGQKVVVGRANLSGKEGAYFLIVTANIVQ
jgi:hypothetical protein